MNCSIVDYGDVLSKFRKRELRCITSCNASSIGILDGKVSDIEKKTRSEFKFFNQKQNAIFYSRENVCVNREEKVELTNDTDTSAGNSQLNQFFSFGAAQFSSCRHSPSKYICTTTTHKRGETKTVEVAYQCCYGFRRLDNKGQCVKGSSILARFRIYSTYTVIGRN